MKINDDTKIILIIFFIVLFISLPVIILINGASVRNCNEIEVTCWKHVDENTKLLLRNRLK